jgi:hypothetical protein
MAKNRHDSTMKLYPLIGVSILLLSIAGCKEPDLGTVGGEGGESPQAQIDRINNNTHMPDSAKSAAIAAIKANAGGAMGSNLADSAKKKAGK